MATSIHSTSGWEKNPTTSPEEVENLPIESSTNDQVSNIGTSYSAYRDDVFDPVAKWPPVAGWPRVSMFMAKKPHFASFARFSDLNVKSLLYYQAQLTSLRKQLHIQERDDQRRYGYGYDFDDDEEVEDDGHDDDITGADAEEAAEDKATKAKKKAEKDLRKKAKADADLATQIARRADRLMDAEGSKQLNLMTDIRKLLKKYSQFPHPSKAKMKTLNGCLL